MASILKGCSEMGLQGGSREAQGCPSISQWFFFFPFSSKRLTVLQDLVHRYVPFWRTMPWTVWSRKADSRRRQRIRLSIALWFRSRLRSFNFPEILFFFCFSSKRLTVLQDRVHCYVPFWRTMPPRTVWSRKADSRRENAKKCEEIGNLTKFEKKRIAARKNG